MTTTYDSLNDWNNRMQTEQRRIDEATTILKAEARARRLADGHLFDEYENAVTKDAEVAAIYLAELDRREFASL